MCNRCELIMPIDSAITPSKPYITFDPEGDQFDLQVPTWPDTRYSTTVEEIHYCPFCGEKLKVPKEIREVYHG